MSNITPFIEQVNFIDTLDTRIRAFAEEEPAKAYLIAHAMDKVSKSIKDDYKDDFKRFYDTQWDLHGGFQCQVVRGSKKYDFSKDKTWASIKATLEAREALLIIASDLKESGSDYTDPTTGEIIDWVPISYSAESYKVTRKK